MPPLVVGDDGADEPHAADHGGLAEDDLELAGRDATLRHGLHIGGRGPRQRAPLLEVRRRALPARHHLPAGADHAQRRRARGVEVRRAAQRGALPAAHGLRAHHRRHVEPIHQAHAVRRHVLRPLRVHRQLHHRRRRRVSRLAVGGGAAADAARARHHAAGPEGGREAEGGEAAAAAVEAGRVVGDGGEAGVRGDQRPHGVRAQVVERQRGARRRRCGDDQDEADEEGLGRGGSHGGWSC
jgi:hypothetical protein